MAGKVKLYAPQEFWKAPEELKKRVCNGCGTKGLGGWLVPDTLYGLSIERACDVHDFMYEIGKTIEDKQAADRVFLNNMLRIIEAESIGILKPLRRARAIKYYGAVVDFGGPAFWCSKNKDETLNDK